MSRRNDPSREFRDLVLIVVMDMIEEGDTYVNMDTEGVEYWIRRNGKDTIIANSREARENISKSFEGFSRWDDVESIIDQGIYDAMENEAQALMDGTGVYSTDMYIDSPWGQDQYGNDYL